MKWFRTTRWKRKTLKSIVKLFKVVEKLKRAHKSILTRWDSTALRNVTVKNAQKKYVMRSTVINQNELSRSGGLELKLHRNGDAFWPKESMWNVQLICVPYLQHGKENLLSIDTLHTRRHSLCKIFRICQLKKLLIWSVPLHTLRIIQTTIRRQMESRS